MTTADDDATPVVLGATSRPETPDTFCRWCGTPNGGCDQASCRSEYDPPRHCPQCGRRLRVLVTPSDMRAECRDHGPLIT